MKIDDLYDRYGESLFRFLAARLGSEQDAEDVLQRTFCRLVRHAVRMIFVQDEKSYLYRVARNEANRFLKIRIKQERIGRRAADVHSMEIPAVPEREPEPRGRIAGALARIPDEQHEVIMLKVVEGMSFREIASVCGRSTNTVASRYRYGIEKLRALLEEKP